MAKKPYTVIQHGLLFSIVLAFIGCAIGICFTLDKKPYAGEPAKVYHEVLATPKVLLAGIKESAQDGAAKANLQARLEDLSIYSDSAAHEKYIRGKFYFAPGNYDNLQLDNKAGVLKDSIGFRYLDTAISKNVLAGKLQLPVKYYATESFFGKYKPFGVWAVLIVIQLMLYFFLVPAVVASTFVTGNKSASPLKLNWKINLLNFTVIIFCFLLFFIPVMWKPTTLQPAFFMQNIEETFGVANAIGYLIVSCILSQVIGIGLVLRSRYYKESEQPEKIKVIDITEKRLNELFMLTAFILSLAVLATGSLFSGLNSLEFLRYVNASTGYTIFTNERLYTYGLIHSFIILLFFLPVKKMISDEKATFPVTATAAGQATGTSHILTPGRKLLELLVSASPFLTSIVQSLFTIPGS